MILKNSISYLLPLLALVVLSACTTIPVDDRNKIRAEVNQTAETTIEQMVANDPAIQTALDQASGYAVASVSATKIPIVGAGYGLALLHDLENNTRTYIDVKRFDLGAGVGAGKFRVLVIFENRESLEKFRDGGWQSALGAESGSEPLSLAVGRAGSLLYRSMQPTQTCRTQKPTVSATPSRHDSVKHSTWEEMAICHCLLAVIISTLT